MSLRRPKRSAVTVALAAGMLGGALAPAASAAALHVAPYKLPKGSTVLPCTSDRPCNLAFALANADRATTSPWLRATTARLC